jgi:hypothetical protein
MIDPRDFREMLLLVRETNRRERDKIQTLALASLCGGLVGAALGVFIIWSIL